jgi:hypothetical protein
MSHTDIASIDNLMKAVYECVTVSPGAPRQWDRERALYRDGAILIADRPGGMTQFTLEEWIASADPILAQGFVEYEIARRVWHFGRIAHVLSAYEARLTPEGPLLKRGINSLQLIHENDRWLIASIVWDNERPDNPMPADLVPAG